MWPSTSLSSRRLSSVFLQTCIVAQSTLWPGVVKGFDFGTSSSIRCCQPSGLVEPRQHEVARFVIDTLQNFLVSADPRLHSAHVLTIARTHFGPKHLPDFVQQARELWVRMSDPQHEVPMLRGGYLKLFQLSNPSCPITSFCWMKLRTRTP